jgi:DNA primase catalytic subunit
MVKFLSTELGVKVKAFETLGSAYPWLSLNHGDSQVTLDIDARHLAETQPHNDQKLCICTMVVCVGCLKASLRVLSLGEYKSMMKFLSTELGVKVKENFSS